MTGIPAPRRSVEDHRCLRHRHYILASCADCQAYQRSLIEARKAVAA